MDIPAPLPYYGPGGEQPAAPGPALGEGRFAKPSPFAQEDFASLLGIPAPQAPGFGPQPSTPSPLAASTAADAPSATPPAPAANPFDTSKTAQTLGAVQAGLAGVQPASASYDVQSGAINAGTSALSGAVSGALLGSAVPVVGTAVGAAVGGGLGLLTGALNAFLGVGAARKANRDRSRLLAAAQAKEDARLKQQRDDAIGQEQFNRGEARKAQFYQLYQDQQKKLADLFLQNDAAKKQYVQDGWVR